MVQVTIEDKKRILGYSGYRKGIELTDGSTERIEKGIETVNRVAQIRTNWRLFEIEESEEGIRLKGTDCYLKGEKIKKHLKGCDKAAMMCGTIGPAFDREVARQMVLDAATGVYLNSCGVVLIEKVMDELQRTIDAALGEGHTGLRYSPGYGDFPLETQKDFAKLLNMEKIVGIRLNSSLLMNPEKSVTAIAGIRYDDIQESYDD